jgi:hypothetical protein
MGPAIGRFLKAVERLAKNKDITINEVYDFAKREFGEVSDLLKVQINRIFKQSDAPSIKKPKPEGKVIEASFKPGVDKKGKVVEESPSQASGIMATEEATTPLMQNLEKGADILREFKRPGMDLTTGMARTAARVILDNAGIKVAEKVDPLEAIAKEFGEDVLLDLRDVADELIEKERAGKITESMGEFLEKRGMFDLQSGRTNMPKGMSDEELEQIKKEVDQEKMIKDFDPTDREPNAMGGINRTNFALGGMKAIMAIINKIKKLDPMDAMKEVNEVVAKRGKYKNLDDDEVKKIFDETNDHIFERDVPADEFAVRFDEEVDIEKGLNDLDELNFTKDASQVKKMLNDMDDVSGMTPKMVERFKLKERFPGIDDRLLTQIIDDPDPQRKAEAIATIDQAFELMRQGKSQEEVYDIMKQMTDRTKQAGGGLQYLMGL